jgi:hypothetical protein
MQLAEFVNTLESLLFSELGTLSNGKPAVVVDYGDGARSTIQDLACYITPSQEIVKSEAVSGNEKFFTEHWVITLVQYDRKKTTLTAARRIHKAFRVFADDMNPVSANAPEQRVMRLLFQGFL